MNYENGRLSDNISKQFIHNRGIYLNMVFRLKVKPDSHNTPEYDVHIVISEWFFFFVSRFAFRKRLPR